MRTEPAEGGGTPSQQRTRPLARWDNRPAVRDQANKNLVLAAMVFAVAMTFIDQTIVAIAIPDIQKNLSLSATGTQWVVNGYLLALSALFAFGGRLADVRGPPADGRVRGGGLRGRPPRAAGSRPRARSRRHGS